YALNGTSVSLNTSFGDEIEDEETNEYNFTLTEETLVYFDVLDGNSSLEWSLEGIQGTLVSSRSMEATDAAHVADANAVLRLPAGRYNLTTTTTEPVEEEDFVLRIVNLATYASSFTPGTPVSGTLSSPNARETDVRSFTADAGDRFYFNST